MQMGENKLRPREELEEALNNIAKNFDFKDAHLELTSDDKLDSLIEFLAEHFNEDEPLAKSISHKYDDNVKNALKNRFKDHLSILLVSDKTGEIIACRTVTVSKRDEPLDLSKVKSITLAKILTFLDHKNDEMDIFKHFNVDMSINFVHLGTHKNFRKQGIASKMMEVAVLFSKQVGINPICIKGEGSSNYSQRIFEKMGFETLHTFRYDEYKVDGEIVFKNMEPHISTKIYVKQI